MADLELFKQAEPKMRASNRYTGWGAANKREVMAYEQYANAILAGTSPTTPPPTLQTLFGQALVLTSQMALPETTPPPPPPPPPPPTEPTTYEVVAYEGGLNRGGVDEMQSWLGRPVIGHEFAAGDNWEGIECPDWLLDPWVGRDMLFSLPPFPGGGSLAAGARGDYDPHYVKAAQNLVAKGFGKARVRPAWEFTGGWYIWSVNSTQSARDLAAMFRRIVNAMMSVPGADFTFVWNPIWGYPPVDPATGQPIDITDAWPGKTDAAWLAKFLKRLLLGIDVYDQSWIQNYRDPAARWNDFLVAPNGYNDLGNFAKEQTVLVCFPEVGNDLATDQGGHGGGDNPDFWRDLHGIAVNGIVPCDHIGLFSYDAPDGNHELDHFPQSKKAVLELLGA